MAWVRWSRVCLPKDKGGLGIRNMEAFNLALLGKWRWRLLVEKENAWNKLMNGLYGEEGVLTQSQRSVWWKDLQLIDKVQPYGNNWFEDWSKLKLGKGTSVKFWFDRWCCQWSLAELFPQLVQLSEAPTGTVADFGCWEGDGWCWKINWAYQLSSEEEELVEELEEMLLPLSPEKIREDGWCWLPGKNMQFSVNSTYCKLALCSEEASVSAAECKILQKFWKTEAPSKYLVHGWRVLFDRLPTRSKLQQRGVLDQQSSICCAFCFRADEDANHLFFNCTTSDHLWCSVMEWLGGSTKNGEDAWEHLDKNKLTVAGKKMKKLRFLFWVAVVWVIWINRNRIIFKGGLPCVNQMLIHVKGITWGWIECRFRDHVPILFEEWNSSPLECIDRLHQL